MDWITKNLLSILNLIVLILLSLYGKAWVNRKKANLEKEIEGLKASHSKELFIHRLQFEKEFETYKYLWMKIAHFRETVENVHILGKLEDRLEDRKEAWDSFLKECKEVMRTILDNTPFISEEVYEKTQQLVYSSLMPVSVGHPKLWTVDLRPKPDTMQDTLEEMFQICNGIEKAIRERIKNLGKAKLIE